MYTLEEIAALRQEIIARKLDTPELWGALTNEDLQKWCNGCGPERFPEFVRFGLSHLLGRYAAAFAIHDIDYMFAGKRDADSRMRSNMLKIWRKDFGIWRYLSKPGLLNRLIVIPLVWAMVSTAGDSAYREAQKEGGGNG